MSNILHLITFITFRTLNVKYQVFNFSLIKHRQRNQASLLQKKMAMTEQIMITTKVRIGRTKVSEGEKLHLSLKLFFRIKNFTCSLKTPEQGAFPAPCSKSSNRLLWFTAFYFSCSLRLSRSIRLFLNLAGTDLWGNYKKFST